MTDFLAWPRLAVVVALLALGACQANTQPPVTTHQPLPPVSDAVPVSGALPTAAPDTSAALRWAAGSITCAELEGHVPVGVDDFFTDLEAGLLTFSWGAARSASVQFLDDATCTVDGDAWTFLIRHNLDPDLLHRSGRLCAYRTWLDAVRPEPANLATVARYLAAAGELCS